MKSATQYFGNCNFNGRKRPYKSPELWSYGEVKDLTRGTGTQPGDAGNQKPKEKTGVG